MNSLVALIRQRLLGPGASASSPAQAPLNRDTIYTHRPDLRPSHQTNMVTDTLKYLPIETAKAARDMAANVVQSFPRSGVTLAQTIQQARGQTVPNFVPTTRFEKNVFGSDPITPAQRSAPTEFLKQHGVAEPTANKLGIGLFAGSLVSDVLPETKGLKGSVKEASTTAKYLEELKGAKQAAKQGEKVSLAKKALSFIADAKRKIVDTAAPIEDVLYQAQKKGKYEVLPSKRVDLQVDRVLRAKTLAGQFAKDNGLEDVIKSAPDIDALDQYLVAKQAARVESLGKKTGRDLGRDQQLIADLAPEYEPHAAKVREYSQKLLDYVTEGGLVSSQTATKLKELYPDYVPLNRIFNETESELLKPNVGTKALASVGKQGVMLKLKGSEREIASPIESLLGKTVDAFEQVERNKAAQMLSSYKDLPGNPFSITPLRTAENVKQRIDLFTEAKELKPVQNKLQRLLSTRSRWARQLDSAINQLNKQGLYKSLKSGITSDTTEIRSSVKQTDFTPKQKVSASPGDDAYYTFENLLDTNKKHVAVGDVSEAQRKFYTQEQVPTRQFEQKYASPNNQQFKQLMSNLVNLPRTEIEAIKSKIATRENNLAPILDDIAEMSDMVDSVKSQRGSLIDEGRLLKDAESRGKATIGVYRDGIKEIYETDPVIAEAAKRLDKRQLGLLERIVAFPVRLGKLGATGLNLPFIARNVVKDQLTAFVQSNRAAQTSLLNPANFVRALFSAVKHDDLYDDLVRSAGGGTSFDMYRNDLTPTVNKIRASAHLGSKVKYAVSWEGFKRGELIHTLEDIIGRSEELTRVQQYKGTYDQLIKEGRTVQDAKLLAGRAARENTVNFARSGDWGQVLNSVLMYSNAGIQGARGVVRNFHQRPVQTSLKVATSVFFPIATITAWNLADPKRRQAYTDIQDYEKDNNLIIIPPNPTQDDKGRWNVVKVPLPPDVSGLGTIVRRTIEGAHGLDPVRFGEVAGKLLQATTSIDASSKQSLVSQLTPQALKPGVEGVTNTNLFTGNPIVPPSLQNLPPEQQVRDSTSGTARIMGNQLHVSPLKVENFIGTSGGGVGKQLLNLADRGFTPNHVGGQDVVDATTASFSKAKGGVEADKIYEAEAKRKQVVSLTNIALKQKIKDAIQTKDVAALSAAQQLDPDNFKRLLQTVLEEETGKDLTAKERAIRSLPKKEQDQLKLTPSSDVGTSKAGAAAGDSNFDEVLSSLSGKSTGDSTASAQFTLDLNRLKRSGHATSADYTPLYEQRIADLKQEIDKLSPVTDEAAYLRKTNQLEGLQADLDKLGQPKSKLKLSARSTSPKTAVSQARTSTGGKTGRARKGSVARLKVAAHLTKTKTIALPKPKAARTKSPGKVTLRRYKRAKHG